MNSVVKPFARQHTYLFLGDTGACWNAYKHTMPTPPLNYIIDAQGVVRYWEEGFTEDSIRRYIQMWLPLPADVGVTRIAAPAGTIDSGTGLTPVCSLYNFGTLPATYQVRMRIGAGYNQTASVTAHAANTAAYVTFPTWTAGPLGLAAVTCSTELTGDGRTRNDRQTGSVTVRAPVPAGWQRLTDVPAGSRGKSVKDGGCLAVMQSAKSPDAEGFVYALKGNGTCEFYQYDIAANTWAAKESIPAIGSSGKKKGVKKGAALTGQFGIIYATKGNNLNDFWSYEPSNAHWTQLTDVPSGAKAIKEGCGVVGVTVRDSDFVYLLRGSGTQDFFRYSVASRTWQAMASAPPGVSGKPYKKGSCLAGDGAGTIYALKGSYNEFFAYDVATNTWTDKTTLPLLGRSGKKKKAGDGAGLAALGGAVYAQKGNSTLEFWIYDPVGNAWTQGPDIPPAAKPVKGGGALTAGEDRLFALNGNQTVAFLQYGPGPVLDGPRTTTASPNAQEAMTRPIACDLRVFPNPVSVSATIRYTMPAPGVCRLSLYDAAGRLVALLAGGYQTSGQHWADLTAEAGLTRGVYLLRFETGGAAVAQKLIIE
jgi:hypothetical protein